MEPLTRADEFEEVTPGDVSLVHGAVGFEIRVADETAGSLEGIAGQVDHIEIESHWEGKGVARAALKKFIELSQKEGEDTVTTSNAVHPAMEYILETEGFEENPDDIGWIKEI